MNIYNSGLELISNKDTYFSLYVFYVWKLNSFVPDNFLAYLYYILLYNTTI